MENVLGLRKKREPQNTSNWMAVSLTITWWMLEPTGGHVLFKGHVHLHATHKHVRLTKCTDSSSCFLIQRYLVS